MGEFLKDFKVVLVVYLHENLLFLVMLQEAHMESLSKQLTDLLWFTPSSHGDFSHMLLVF